MISRLTAVLPLAMLTLGACSTIDSTPICCEGGYEYRQGQRNLPTRTLTEPRVSSTPVSSPDQTALSTVQQHNQMLQAELAALKQHQAAVKQETAGVLSGFAEALRDCEQKLEQAQSAPAPSTPHDPHIAELEQANASLKQHNASLTEALSAASHHIETLTRELAGRDQTIATLQGDFSTEAARLKQAQHELLTGLKPHVDQGHIRVHLAQSRLMIQMASRFAFASGDDQLTGEGVQMLTHIAGILKDFPEYTVTVTGHTDNLPIRPRLQARFASNQLLAHARATHASQILIDGGLPMVMTQSFGDTNPLASNATEEGRAQNRRIELEVAR